MLIRQYQPGDEETQTRIYNAAAGPLPRFKPATAEEVTRRYASPAFDPSTRFYAVEGGETIGYAVFDTNGRISFPWTLPGSEHAQGALLGAVLEEMMRRGLREAWAAYRADWKPILDRFAEHGFLRTRDMVNYVAGATALPRAEVPEGYSLHPLTRDDSEALIALRQNACAEGDPGLLGRFYWENPFFSEESLFALRRNGAGPIVAAGLLVVNAGYADPTRIDAAMPCFRLGAFGTEAERHKRVNGMFSMLSDSEETGAIVLAEAARRLAGAGLAHMAAQAPSDRPEQLVLLDRYFERQASFPILTRSLARSGS